MRDVGPERGPRSGPRFFYGWWMVALAFLANFVSVGTGFYVFNVIVKPVCERYGWSRTDANLALIIATVVGAFGQIVYGTMIMRVGPRILMVAGAILAGASFVLLGRAGQLWTFYLFYTLLFLGNGAYGGIVANTVVNNWFVAKRGRALGLATVGTSFSGSVVPFIALRIMERAGFDQAFTWIGIGITVMAPVSWLLVRRAPEDYGLLPDGDDPLAAPDLFGKDLSAASPRGGILESGAVVIEPARASVWTPAMLARTAAFWKIGFAYAAVMIGVVGVMSQLAANFTDVGYSARTATAITGATALLGAAGKFFWAALCDRFKARKVVTVLFLTGAAGLSLIFFPASKIALAGFVLLFGFGMGGVMSTFPVLIAELYGRFSFAAVARFTGMFLMLQVIGYYLAAQSYDLTRSYNTAYTIYLALDLLGILLIVTVKKPRLKNGWHTEQTEDNPDPPI